MDPLSPYLFILCMEVLRAFILEKCSSNCWDPVKASQGGLTFSHLFFVNDLVLFAKADRKNCVVVREVLDSFCSIFGQKVSQDKSWVYFSLNVLAEERTEMCDILGFHSTPSLGKYFGIPINHSARTQDFGYIIERVQSRLAGWKSNLLSFVGRLVLTQAVTTTVPNYAMQCAALPVTILNSIERLSRNFLWGSSVSKKKIHLVSWKKITKPKRVGRLGIQATREKKYCKPSQVKLVPSNRSSSLWARVITQKYNSQRRIANPSNIRGSCSSI